MAAVADVVAVGAEIDDEKSMVMHERWNTTISNVLPAIVEINTHAVRCFDGGSPALSTASGFVVDAEGGLILTNRHVVSTGPVTMHVIFPQTQEEIEVVPIYRDPVHDFAFCRFDPSALKYTKVCEIELHPEELRVGAEIRVIGNDAAEKLQILSGTIGRTDRAAPAYGFPYTDFNTFYIGAASGTSPGSSGSPVLNVKGHAVALNCGAGVSSNAAFYLPLDRVVVARKLLMQRLAVPRGTIQAIFKYLPYNEAQKLGLTPDVEKELREAFPEKLGLLSVEALVKGGPAVGKVAEGDLLIKINGKLVVDFLMLESTLDNVAKDYFTYEIVDNDDDEKDTDSSSDALPPQSAAQPARAGSAPPAAGGGGGRTIEPPSLLRSATYTGVPKAKVGQAPVVKLHVLRAGVPMDIMCEVYDLHRLVPRKFLEVGGAVLHRPSLSMAVTASAPVDGVYIATQGVLFRSLPDHCVLEMLNGQPVKCLRDVVTVMSDIPHGHFFTVQYRALVKPEQLSFSEGRCEHRLMSMQIFSRDYLKDVQAPCSGHRVWGRVDLDTHRAAAPPLIRGMSLFAAGQSMREEDEKANHSFGFRRKKQFMVNGVDCAKIRHAIVSVMAEDSLTYAIDGSGVRVPWTSLGCVLDKKQGLVLVPRCTAHTYMSNVMVIFQDVVRVAATVVYLHPSHNIAIVRYDAAQLPDSLPAEEVEVAMKGPKMGDQSMFVQANHESEQPVVARCGVGALFHKSATIDVGCPEFNQVDRNTTIFGGVDGEGVYLTKEGKLYSIRYLRIVDKQSIAHEDLYVSADAHLLRELLQCHAFDRPLRSRWIQVDFGLLKLGEARRLFGLSREWIVRFERNKYHFKSKHEDPADVDDVQTPTSANGDDDDPPASAVSAVALQGDQRVLPTHDDDDEEPVDPDDGDATGALKRGKDKGTGVLFVNRPMTQTDASRKLRRGDLVLKLDGHFVTTFLKFEKYIRDKEEVELLLWRNQEEVTVKIRTERMDRQYQPMHAVEWSGATLVTTEEAVRLIGRVPDAWLDDTSEDTKGVFCSIIYAGSPAAELEPGCWILAINDTPVMTLEDVLEVVTGLGDKEHVRITIFNFSANRQMVRSLKTDLLFWPTTEFFFNEDAQKWERVEHHTPWKRSGGRARTLPYHSSFYKFPTDIEWMQAKGNDIKSALTTAYYRQRRQRWLSWVGLGGKKGSTDAKESDVDSKTGDDKAAASDVLPIGSPSHAAALEAAAVPAPPSKAYAKLDELDVHWWNEDLLPSSLRPRPPNKWVRRGLYGAVAAVSLGGAAVGMHMLYFGDNQDRKDSAWWWPSRFLDKVLSGTRSRGSGNGSTVPSPTPTPTPTSVPPSVVGGVHIP